MDLLDTLPANKQLSGTLGKNGGQKRLQVDIHFFLLSFLEAGPR